MSVVLFAFLVKHFICDWVLQTKAMAEGKAMDKIDDWFYPLFAHSIINAIGTFVVVFWSIRYLNNHGFDSIKLYRLLMVAAGVDLLTHMFIDKIKMILNKKLVLSINDSLFWNLIGLDQLCHFTVYFMIVRYLEIIVRG